MAWEGIKAIFEPKSVLLVGATGIKERPGVISPALFTSMISNMSSSFKGKINVLDLSGRLSGAIKNLKDVPKKQDLAVLTAPPELALKGIGKLVDRGIKAIILPAGGYNNLQLEQLVRATVKRGVRVLGPNASMGVLNTENGLCTAFERGLIPVRGKVALISQDSDLGAAMLDWACFHGIGLSKFASFGDKVDVNEVDLLNYLAQDDDTGAICIYMEWIEEGRKFTDAIREAAKRKPVSILRAIGKGTGRDEIFDAAVKQAGAIRARNIEDLFNSGIALALQPPMRGNRVAIISNSEGPAKLAAGAIERKGLKLATLSEDVKKTIKSRYPSIDLNNPINMKPDARAEHYGFILEKVLSDPNVDGVMVINMLRSRVLKPADLEIVAKATKKSKEKPVVDVTVGGEDAVLVRGVLREREIPTYDLPEKAAPAMKALYKYWQFREKLAKSSKLE
jgi:acyl-CoA synthetase (NDP forming)